MCRHDALRESSHLCLETQHGAWQPCRMSGPTQHRPNLERWLRRTIGLVAPPRCAICAQQCDADHVACESCLHGLKIAPIGFDGPTRSRELDHVFAAYEYSGAARAAVHALKYSGRVSVAPLIAARIAERMPPTVPLNDCVLVPVPAHPDNARQRGFNQSLLVARALGKLLDVPVSDRLRRKGSSPPQSQLSRAERLRLPADEFVYEPGGLRHRDRNALANFPTNVVVCDDVTTTTCTLEACASAIRERHSVQTIHGLTFASVSPKDTSASPKSNSAGHGTTDRIA